MSITQLNVKVIDLQHINMNALKTTPKFKQWCVSNDIDINDTITLFEHGMSYSLNTSIGSTNLSDKLMREIITYLKYVDANILDGINEKYISGWHYDMWFEGVLDMVNEDMFQIMDERDDIIMVFKFNQGDDIQIINLLKYFWMCNRHYEHKQYITKCNLQFIGNVTTLCGSSDNNDNSNNKRKTTSLSKFGNCNDLVRYVTEFNLVK